MSTRAPVPMVVVGGYLGAGKTTMLNRLLANGEGRCITVLVNDFGEINIDAVLVRSRSDDVIQLENGCICCSIGGRLADALAEIGQREKRPDLLVIEASGVSDPQRIAQVGLLDAALRLNGVVVAVDAESVFERLADPLVGDMVRRQITGASAVVLTKGDLAGPTGVETAMALIAEIAPHATVLVAHHGEVPWEVFADVAEPRPASPGLLGGRGDWRSATEAGQHAGIRTLAYRTGRVFDKARLRQALKDLPVRLLRAKGIVRLVGDADLHEVHLVGGRLRMGRLESADRMSESALVFIGAFGDAGEAAVRATMDQALA